MNHSIETIAYPAIPPILRSDFDESKKHKTGIEVDKENWKKQLSETSKVIEDRRRKELKN